MIFGDIEFFQNDRHQPATTESLEYFTKLSGYTLPDDYRNFLLTVNGGRPWWGKNQIYIACPKRREIDLFHPFIKFKLYTAQPGIWKTDSLRRPPFLFEVAVLSNDQSIVMDVHPERMGHIYAIRSASHPKVRTTKESSIEEVLDEPNTFTISDSFSGFVSLIEVVRKASDAP